MSTDTPVQPKRVRREYNRGWADGNASALDACNPVIQQQALRIADLEGAAREVLATPKDTGLRAVEQAVLEGRIEVIDAYGEWDESRDTQHRWVRLDAVYGVLAKEVHREG